MNINVKDFEGLETDVSLDEDKCRELEEKLAGVEDIDADTEEGQDGFSPLFMPIGLSRALNKPLPPEARIEMEGENGQKYPYIHPIVYKYWAAKHFGDRWNTEIVSMDVIESEDVVVARENGTTAQGRRDTVVIQMKVTVKGDNGHCQVHTAHGVGSAQFLSINNPNYKASARAAAITNAESKAIRNALERFGSGFIQSRDARAIIKTIQQAQAKRRAEKARNAGITPGTASFKGNPIGGTSRTKAKVHEQPAGERSKAPSPAKAPLQKIIEDDIPAFEPPTPDDVMAQTSTPVEDHPVSAQAPDVVVEISLQEPPSVDFSSQPLDAPSQEAHIAVAGSTPTEMEAAAIEADFEASKDLIPRAEFVFDEFLAAIPLMNDVEALVDHRALHEDAIEALPKKQQDQIKAAIRRKMKEFLALSDKKS